MKERPIIFNADMVRAILEGSKTQTRRIMKPQPEPVPGQPWEYWWPAKAFETMVKVSDLQRVGFEGAAADASPFGRIGDRLWVRETFGDCGVRLVYRADTDDGAACQVKRWTPSIHMPREAARILLEITDVRVERLNNISVQDALAEGMDDGSSDAALAAGWFEKPRRAFRRLWERIYGQESWSSNPWVWVVEFQEIQEKVTT
ncbi:hypothetical protein ACET9O_14975 [Aeromonas caviae]|uniref:hypothetical protein n=1 Tax=Aeromonas caviae TaxID=648 RepID=UPI0038D1940C